MKTLSILISLLLQSSNIKGSLNQILSDYGVPIVALIIILSGVGGLIGNLDKIMDSDGRGTRKEGLLNIVYIMGGVVLVVVLIGVILTLVGQISLNI